MLDNQKEYLFSFGKELWHETGNDDGALGEADEAYEMKFTVAEPGDYYLKIKTQGDYTPGVITVSLASTVGSSVPHFAFGVITLLIGIVLNEVSNRTLIRLTSRFRDEFGNQASGCCHHSCPRRHLLFLFLPSYGGYGYQGYSGSPVAVPYGMEQRGDLPRTQQP